MFGQRRTVVINWKLDFRQIQFTDDETEIRDKGMYLRACIDTR